tara:strand:- start:335 stop:700 length:366 start_codon:yes stop_codon:yes gene_type:complete
MSYANHLQLARKLAQNGMDGSSAGAVLVKGDEVIAKSHDCRRQQNNPIASAEMECIRLAGRRTDQSELTLISTEYPDLLTAGTVLQFSIGALVIGRAESSSPAIDLLKAKGVPITFYPDNE